MDEDASIMIRVQRGQPELFEVLVRRYREVLIRVAESRLRDRSWAEDIVQEAFLAAFAARGTYRPEFAFRTWLWTILLNLCSRHWRRNLPPAGSRIDSRDAARDEPACEETGLVVAVRAERRERLLKSLDQLPEVQADAIRLRFFGGLKFSEIAEIMGSSLNAAKIRVKHGLATLGELLHAEDSGNDLR